MKLADIIPLRARYLNPGCFALVMATGIVSIDASQHDMQAIAQALFAFNLVAYAWLLALTGLRLVRYRRELVADFANPSRGAGFLTFAAGTCVLGSQCLQVVPLQALAAVLAVVGAAAWATLTYLFFAVTITARFKPGFTRSINGGWLVAVVATEALSTLLTLLAASRADPGHLRFLALGLYMLGAALYLLIITLVVYRMVFFPLRAREFTPPYWIDMGALAIITLAGSLIITHAPASGPIVELLPFVKGFTVFSGQRQPGGYPCWSSWKHGGICAAMCASIMKPTIGTSCSRSACTRSALTSSRMRCRPISCWPFPPRACT